MPKMKHDSLGMQFTLLEAQEYAERTAHVILPERQSVMVFFITGASGSGKTACFDPLSLRHPDIYWYDFDERGVPDDADTAWRQRQTEMWLITALDHQVNGQDTAICGGAIPGEISRATRPTPRDVM